MTVDDFLHPNCPDRAHLPRFEPSAPVEDDGVPRPRTREELLRYGPTEEDAAIRVHAEAITSALASQKDQWRGKWTRRRVIAGAGAVGVAALGTQLVTTKVSFGAPAQTDRTLILVMLRGGMDGLAVIPPRNDANYRAARPQIAVPDAAMLETPNERRFGLHPSMAALHPLWLAGQMAVVHAVASPDASRSHFQAQDAVERGAASTAVHTGFLDRVLAQMGPGTTFRAISSAGTLPRALVGGQPKLVMRSIGAFRLEGDGAVRERSMEALKALYTGVEHPLAAQATATISAIGQAQRLAQMPDNPAVRYQGGFGDGLRDLAKMVKANVGLRVAQVDIGGWDMHTGLGTVDGGDMRNHLQYMSEQLAAFATDVGPAAFAKVNIVLLSEFGRRVEQNGNAGSDHGHGYPVIMLGGGLNGGRVHGAWPGLAPAARDNGDLAGANDYRDVVGELLKVRFNVADLPKIFPGHTPKRIGAVQGA